MSSAFAQSSKLLAHYIIMCDYEKKSRKELEKFADRMRIERNTLLLENQGERIMHKDCKQVIDIVNLWAETQMGCMHKCKEKQFEFADMMWGLYNNNKIKKGDKETMGRAINMENKIGALEQRVKLVEDALEEMIQTRVHHVDLDSKLDKHEKDLRSVKLKGVELEPDEEYTAPVGKRKSTSKTTKSKRVESLT